VQHNGTINILLWVLQGLAALVYGASGVIAYGRMVLKPIV